MFLWDLIYRRFSRRGQLLIMVVPLAFIGVWVLVTLAWRAIW